MNLRERVLDAAFNLARPACPFGACMATDCTGIPTVRYTTYTGNVWLLCSSHADRWVGDAPARRAA